MGQIWVTVYKESFIGKKIYFHLFSHSLWLLLSYNSKADTHHKNCIIKMLLALCRECLLIPDLRHWPRPFICKCLRGLDYMNSKFYATSCLLSCFHQFICVWLYRSRLHQHSCQQYTFFFFLLFSFSCLNTLNKYGTLNRTIINCNRKKDQYSLFLIHISFFIER